jgi:hypothetical protein
MYLSGISAIEIWSQFFHHHVFGDRLPFLPLIMVSFYSGFWNYVLMDLATRMDSQAHLTGSGYEC